ncbi:hypothetical protein BCR32DRAFT_204302, partial [Anaeromyces robustus]
MDNTCYTINDVVSNPEIQTKKVGKVYYNWNDLEKLKHERMLVVYNGNVLDLTDFLSTAHPDAKYSNDLDNIIRNRNSLDITYSMSKNSNNKKAIKCMNEMYKVGIIGKTTSGCIISNIFLVLTLIFVIGVIIIKFCMAIIFSWFLKWPMGDRYGYIKKIITCYSEGHDGIANTLDSLSNTEYPDSLKLIVVICDGLVKGEGNDEYTPDIVIDMVDPGNGSSYYDRGPQEPKSYVAIAEGQKRHNMAQIYAGWYRYAINAYSRKVPMIGIIKCGTESERIGPNRSPKPGNRGKRDSQILLLGFLSRVMFNERMTEFDFDLFTKIYELTGVHADVYESIMMVDADTIV